jgi:hypothetical protein
MSQTAVFRFSKAQTRGSAEGGLLGTARVRVEGWLLPYDPAATLANMAIDVEQRPRGLLQRVLAHYVAMGVWPYILCCTGNGAGRSRRSRVRTAVVHACSALLFAWPQFYYAHSYCDFAPPRASPIDCTTSTPAHPARAAHKGGVAGAALSRS